ncbi:AMP-binding protein [Ruegeria lacuscaerulensis]|uniref:AMP-binding protein n=1 Tax=Ruegeria lacuscaerulensis TaxID=55218 RepID=UPI00147B6C82|nr:AMP-binding protein [Ruegeria lacuscaerulensis]
MGEITQQNIWPDMQIEIDPNSYSSVVEMFEQAFLTYPEKTAYVGLGGSLSYAEADRLSRDFAAVLQAKLGVKKGDRIALMAPNILAFPIAMLGIIRAGGVQVNVNPMYTPHELEHQLNDAGAEIIVVFGGSTSTLAEVVDNTPIKTVITIDLGDTTTTKIPSPPVDERLSNTLRFAELLDDGEELDFDPPVITGDDLLFLQYTGGTTGLSKAAVLTHRNLVANTEQTKAALPEAMRHGQEVVVTPLPLYHIFALMVNMITYSSIGATNYLVANPRDPEQLISAYRDSGFTVSTAVNTLIAGLAAHPGLKDIDFSNYRAMIGGGAPVQEAVSNRWKEVTGHHVLEGYGMSETSPVLTLNPMGQEEFSAAVGYALPSTDIIFLDEDDHQVGVGEAGEICAKGPQVMQGYWNRPEETASNFTEDGYFRTGDIGVRDENGLIKIVDRKKDMVLVSGFNVYPNEIEAHVAMLDDVAECAAIGVPDEKTGEAIRLFISLANGSDLTSDQVIEHCRQGLAGYKVPKQIRFLDELPKSTVGKILRKDLREL